MNATLQAQQAYGRSHSPVRTGRTTELQLFGQITARLRDAAAARPLDFPKLAAALYENRRLWTHLAAEVADGENELPKDLRARIFYLAEFTGLHTDLILRGTAEVEPLIDINTAVMRGLAAEATA